MKTKILLYILLFLIGIIIYELISNINNLKIGGQIQQPTRNHVFNSLREWIVKACTKSVSYDRNNNCLKLDENTKSRCSLSGDQAAPRM